MVVVSGSPHLQRWQVPGATRNSAAQPRCRERGVLGCQGVRVKPPMVETDDLKWMVKLKIKVHGFGVFFFPWL